MENSLVSGFDARVGELMLYLQDVPTPTAGQWGLLVLAVGMGMAIPYIEKTWWPKWKAKREAKRLAKSELRRKTRRTREAMDIREVRLQELLCDMIVDGLLKYDVEGKISGQEHRRLIKEFGEKMGLNDLLNTKGRAQMIKDAIIRRLARDIHNVNTVTVDKCGRRAVNTKIPGPKPGEPTTDVVGKANSSRWSSKRVAS